MADYSKYLRYSEGSGTLCLVNSNVKMALDMYGKYVEVLGKNFVMDDKTKNVMPIFSGNINEDVISKELYGNNKNVIYKKLLGYYQSLYIGYVAESDFRAKGTSGGIATWILCELLREKLVDGVINVKCVGKGNPMFKYEISHTIEEVREGAKTKYYPVELSEVLKLVRDVPGRYAVIGIPSFIYAIRLLQRQSPIFKERIPYTVGIICGHQKTTCFSESIAWQSGITPGNLEFIDFRKKIPTEPANKEFVELKGKISGKEVDLVKPMSDFPESNWGLGLFKVQASDFVDDVFNETADIVLGDAWLPKYEKDGKGTNIVIIRNEQIAKIVDSAAISNRLHLERADYTDVLKSQAAGIRHTYTELSYRLYKCDRENIWRPKERVEPSPKLNRYRKEIQDSREDIARTSNEAFYSAKKSGDLNIYLNSINPLIKEYKNIYKKYYFSSPRRLIKKIIQKIKKVFSNS